MSKIRTKEQFINAAILKFGDLYNYSRVLYVNSKTKIEILCKKHGSFYQNPNNFLRNNGCHKCAVDRKVIPLRFTTEEFCKKASIIHSNKYDYSQVKYEGCKSKINILCPDHGVFKQSPHSHLAGSSCPLCGRGYGKSTANKRCKDFIDFSNRVHNNFYDYSKSVYTKCTNKTTIVCPVHGEFFMSPNRHKNGNGCKQCYYDRAGYSKHSFTQACRDGTGVFYVLKCYNYYEEFIKIGITGRTVKKRYSSKSHMPYLYTVLQEIKYDAELIWRLERLNLKLLKDKSYTPQLSFEGETECFTLDCLQHIKYEL